MQPCDRLIVRDRHVERDKSEGGRSVIEDGFRLPDGSQQVLGSQFLIVSGASERSKVGSGDGLDLMSHLVVDNTDRINSGNQQHVCLAFLSRHETTHL